MTRKLFFMSLVAFLLLAGWKFSIPLTFTRSKEMALYGSDLVALVTWPWLCLTLWREKEIWGFLRERFLRLALLVLVGVAISGLRLIKGQPFIPSLVVFRALVMAIWLWFLVDLRPSWPWQEALFISSLFFCLINFFLNIYEGPLAYRFYQSHSVRSLIHFILFSGVVWFGLHAKRTWVVWLNLFFLIVNSAFSGQRLAMVLRILLILYILWLVHGKIRLATVGVTLAAYAMVFLLSLGFVRMRYGIYRLPSTRWFVSMDTIQSVYDKITWDWTLHEPGFDAKAFVKENLDGQAETSGQESSYSRFVIYKEALAEWKKAPLLGPGYRQFEVVYPHTKTKVVIPAHNFILELGLAFGLLGFISYMMLILWEVAGGLVESKSWPCQMYGLVTLGVIGVILSLQPIILNPVVLTYIFFSLALMVGALRQKEIVHENN